MNKGKRYGRLLVTGNCIRGSKFIKVKYECLCDCGNLIFVRGSDLVSGKTKSCGCFRKEVCKIKGAKSKTHGETGSKLWTSWQSMKRRCSRGGSYEKLGVKVCEEWNENYFTFRDWALNNGYSENLTLDRIDTYGNYEPINCRWATYKVQENNRRNNRRISYLGEERTMAEWSDIYGITSSLISYRLKMNWPIEKLFQKPNNAHVKREAFA